MSRPPAAGLPPLRISLDVSAVPAQPTGAGRYTLDLMAALLRRGDVELVAISRRADAARFEALVAGHRRPDGPRAEVAPWVPDARPARLLFEQVGLPGRLRRAVPDVHHGPHYTMPEWAPVPCVVTVHDCTFFDHPEWHERTKVPFFRRAIRAAARRAGAVVCVSQTTAERLHAVCRVRAPVVVAPHGVDHARFTPAEPLPGADVTALRALELDPDWPLVTFVGTLEPRKGVVDLVKAFDRVAPAHPEARLVLAGQPGWGGEALELALAVAKNAGRVVRTGYVDDATVPALLRRSSAVAYPSLAEGFGLPALEALACGAPLVTTVGTAMAELAGPAALLVPPADPDQLAQALDTLLAGADPRAATERRLQGLAVAAGRTWEASAEAHLVAYRRAAAAPPLGRRPMGRR